MIYITRTLEEKLDFLLSGNKVIVITGARRVGKTTLIKELTIRAGKRTLFLNGEDISTWELLSRRTAENYRNLLSDYEILIIDEAQNIPDVGLIAKLIHDEIPQKNVILTGSSSFDLVQKTGEPLTGRKINLELLAFSEQELWKVTDVKIRKDELLKRLVTGNYPEIISISSQESRYEYLKELRDSYLIRDIIKFENIRNAEKIQKLLRLIAFQVGSEVSLQELGTQLSMSKNTVERYLDLLIKSFVLFKLEGFSRNLRKEITKTAKYYFYDNGILNIVKGNMNEFAIREDKGALWENYMVSERMKFKKNDSAFIRHFFWRTYDQQEIDLIEEEGTNLSAFEMKWGKSKTKIPGAWTRAYPGTRYEIINPENYLPFVGV